MRRLLVFGDSVCAKTGFSRVVRNAVSGLARWEITQVGINHPGPTSQHAEIDVIDARQGADRSLLGADIACELYRERDFDLALVVQDLHRASDWAAMFRDARAQRRIQGKKLIPIIFLTPVDGPMLGNMEFVEVADVTVTPTSWGRSIINQHTEKVITVIPHAVDTTVFRPLDEGTRAQLRRDVYNVDEAALTVLCLGVNSDRKDWYKSLEALSVLQARFSSPIAKLYLHTDPQSQGIDTYAQIASLRLKHGIDVQLADPGMLGAPDAMLNQIYNASDVLLFTSRREGWGLPMTEAMAAGTAVAAPNFGPFAEVLGDGDLGYLHEPACRVWTRGDSRGPGWLSSAQEVADVLEAVHADKFTPAFDAARQRARARCVERFEDTVVAAIWSRLIHRSIAEATS